MRQFLFRNLILPAFETVWKRRKTFHYWHQLEQSQWFSRARLEEIQFQALQRLIRHAFAHCPYYRQIWLEQGLDPQQLRSPEDFRRWPVIGREMIQAQRLRMRANLPGLRLLHKATGGSNGTPLHFDLDTDSNDRRTGAWHRGYNWAGAGPGTKQLYLWGGALGRPSALETLEGSALFMPATAPVAELL